MEKNYTAEWKKACIRIGTPTNLLAAVAAFLPAIYLCATYDCWPTVQHVMSAWGMVLISFGAFYLVEPISYYASLGLAGTYLGFLSGNIGNMRLPCANLALDVTKSETGTLQAEIVSTMAICGSIITNLIATTAAALVGTVIIGFLPEVVKKALQTYCGTAIYGATFGNLATKNPKVAIFGLGIPFVCRFFFSSLPVWVMLVLSVFGTLGVSRLFYVMEKKKAAN